MRRIRDLVSFLILLLATAISVAAAVHVARQEMPEPLPTENLDFGQWMTERDLSAESEQVNRLLAQRLESELRGGNWSARLRDLDEQQQQRLRENFLRVMEQYFVEKMQRYFERPEEKREAYLDRELDKLTRLLERHAPPQLASADHLGSGSLAAIALINLQIEQWISRAQPEQQPQMRQFQAAVVDQLNRRATDRALEGR